MSTVLLDCDGVLSDFVGHMTALLKARGHEIPEVTEYDFLRGFGDDVGAVARSLLKDGGTWMTMPAYPEARAGVDAIRAAGHDVIVVTAPWWSCETWDHVRRKWLYGAFDVKSENIITTSKKHLVRGHAFVDDKAEAVEAWRLAHVGIGTALLMDRPYNRDPKHNHLDRFAWPHVEALLRRLA
jgi:5'(3')-deoxyribonucleotidase